MLNIVSIDPLHYVPKLPPGALPPEVISRIMKYVARATVFKTTNDIDSAEEPVTIICSTLDLQRLRLVSREWARVVPYFLFDVVRLQTANMARHLIEDWGGSILSSPKSPMRVLSLDEVWYGAAPPESPRRMPMHYGAKVIMTFGINLTSLTLILGNSMVVTCDMIRAVQHIRCLTRLSIIRRYDYPRRIDSDSASIGQLLAVTPALESLAISLPYLETEFLLPNSLPVLRHLWFQHYASSDQGLTQLVRATNSTLKTIEYNSEDSTTNTPSRILRESRFNLESLCIDIAPTNLPHAATSTLFPKLRCIRTTSWPEEDFDLTWLDKPLFRSIQTLVTKYTCGHVYWMRALNSMQDAHFPRPPNWKHIVFTNIRGTDLVDDMVVWAFSKYDIQCHFRPALKFEEILALDLELNGPMRVIPDEEE